MLVEKTCGEAGEKVKSVEAGQELLACHIIYLWVVNTSGIALQDRARNVTFPEPMQKGERLMDALEAFGNKM